MDITYLKNDIYKKKTTFKYIIDFIDHFTKFYLGFLIKDKCTETILKYIKLFIQINKKLKIFQCDNGTEFANHLISNFMESQNIKLIHSRPHHPQSNGCLERYHYEVQKYMYNYLKDMETIMTIKSQRH